LLLCTNSLQHSQLVLREGVIPALVSLSVGNNPRAQDKAQKLLQHFREQRQKETVFSHSAPLSMSLSMGAVGGETSEAEPQQESSSPKNAGASLRKEEKKRFGKSRSGSLNVLPTCLYTKCSKDDCSIHPFLLFLIPYKIACVLDEKSVAFFSSLFDS
jgi:hypothetical protein